MKSANDKRVRHDANMNSTRYRATADEDAGLFYALDVGAEYLLEPSTVTQHPINAGVKPVSVHTSSNYWMTMQAPTLPDLFVKKPQLVSEMMKLVHKSCLPI